MPGRVPPYLLSDSPSVFKAIPAGILFIGTGVHQIITQDNLTYSAAIDAYRRDMILNALAQSKGNRTAAAKKLGLHEKSLLRLIKSLRIS